MFLVKGSVLCVGGGPQAKVCPPEERIKVVRNGSGTGALSSYKQLRLAGKVFRHGDARSRYSCSEHWRKARYESRGLCARDLQVFVTKAWGLSVSPVGTICAFAMEVESGGECRKENGECSVGDVTEMRIV